MPCRVVSSGFSLLFQPCPQPSSPIPPPHSTNIPFRNSSSLILPFFRYALLLVALFIFRISEKKQGCPSSPLCSPRCLGFLGAGSFVCVCAEPLTQRYGVLHFRTWRRRRTDASTFDQPTSSRIFVLDFFGALSLFLELVSRPPPFFGFRQAESRNGPIRFCFEL